MARSAALPFLLERGTQVFTASGMTTTSETVHGLLRLEPHQLTIQWRLGRKTQHLDSGMRTDEEVEPVREITVPLQDVAGAVVRRRWWDRVVGPHLVLTAADLSAFEELAGESGLRLDHPAELLLRLRRSDRLAGEEFGAELALAIAENNLAGVLERTPMKGQHAAPPLEPAPSQDRRSLGERGEG